MQGGKWVYAWWSLGVFVIPLLCECMKLWLLRGACLGVGGGGFRVRVERRMLTYPKDVK